MIKEAYALLEEMTCNNYLWLNEQSIMKRFTRVHEVDQLAALSPQVAFLTNQIKNLTIKDASSSQEKTVVARLSYADKGLEEEQCQYINNQNYNFRPRNNLLTHYHLRLRNHRNFSYENQRNALQPHHPLSF
ncbi:hypothetical protein OWV82_024306 [Melia azedarach]|uniref:Uncharacterized protein n=1 Tax=Melia azedarach TaxID=155640 RepID=A0ACC1WPD3_MELAZ|nr:hypothetical protein OWV82_024306 [Melia azedarach]